MPRLFDVHSHLSSPRLRLGLGHGGRDKERRLVHEVIEAAKAAGVEKVGVCAVCEEDWAALASLSRQYESFIVPNFGLHPWWADKISEGRTLNTLKSYLLQFPSAGVGEIGLDKSRKGQRVPMEVQAEAFKEQLKLAQDLNRPITIHCVSAQGKLLEILQATMEKPCPPLLFHSYSGSLELTRNFAKVGPAYFSFSAAALCNTKKNKAQQLCRELPLSSLLIESDAPDQLPLPEVLEEMGLQARPSPSTEPDYELGSSTEKLNEPAFLTIALQRLASILEMEETDLAGQLYDNACTFFKLGPPPKKAQ